VSILIQKNDSRINFQLSDDGKGFIGKPKEKTGGIHRGLGMKAMKKRSSTGKWMRQDILEMKNLDLTLF